jgi:hypothetical protein
VVSQQLGTGMRNKAIVAGCMTMRNKIFIMPYICNRTCQICKICTICQLVVVHIFINMHRTVALVGRVFALIWAAGV